MSESVTPAPLWRRLVAAVYDGLLLVALWMIAAMADVLVRGLLGLTQQRLAFQLLLFFIGMAFFGWFWTHGGQTLGMRAWRLRVRRDDGGGLRWPTAAVRYGLAYVSWISVIGTLWSLIDARRRTLHDVLTGTEVVVLPKTEAQAMQG